MKSIKQLTPEKKAKGLRSLDMAHQFILSKKLSNGAYSEWSDQIPNIETTALVAKFLSIVKDWKEINDQDISQALLYLKGQQKRDGKYANNEGAIEDENRIRDEVALTAFTVISFLDNKPYVERHKQAINKALSFINGKFTQIRDSYALSIATYALALGKHESASQFLNELMTKAVEKGDKTSWEGSSNVETAAYAVLSFVELERPVEAKNIIAWLLTQRSQTGGFSTPKETVVGLQAIAEIAKTLHSNDFDMNVYFLYEPNQVTGFAINNNNAKVVQNVTIPTWEGVSVQVSFT